MAISSSDKRIFNHPCIFRQSALEIPDLTSGTKSRMWVLALWSHQVRKRTPAPGKWLDHTLDLGRLVKILKSGWTGASKV